MNKAIKDSIGRKHVSNSLKTLSNYAARLDFTPLSQALWIFSELTEFDRDSEVLFMLNQLQLSKTETQN